MIQTFSLAFIFLAWLLLPGCKCNDDRDVIPDTTLVSTPTPVQTPIYFNVYGALFAIRQVTRTPDSISSEIAYAMLFDGPASTTDTPGLVDAGQVSVNNIPLNKADNNFYQRTAAEGYLFSNLNLNQNTSWHVQGNDGIPPSAYLMSGKFPRYSGEYPALIRRSEGLTLTFDASTLIYTDSVFVAISAGDKLIIKRYGAKAGTVTIPPDELTPLQKCPSHKPGYLQISLADCTILPWYGRPTVVIKASLEIRHVLID